MANIHLTPISPDTDPADFIAMLEANIIGVQKNNQAVSALKRGDFARAEKLHKEALKLKMWGFGDESIQAAISYNGLGGTYLKMGPSKLDQAENSFKKALRIVDYREFGGLGKGSAQDAAMTRDNMAQLLEARGKMTEAKEMRLKGAKKGEIICGSIEVSNFRTQTIFPPYLGSFKEGAKLTKCLVITSVSTQAARCCPSKSSRNAMAARLCSTVTLLVSRRTGMSGTSLSVRLTWRLSVQRVMSKPPVLREVSWSLKGISKAHLDIQIPLPHYYDVQCAVMIPSHTQNGLDFPKASGWAQQKWFGMMRMAVQGTLRLPSVYCTRHVY